MAEVIQSDKGFKVVVCDQNEMQAIGSACICDNCDCSMQKTYVICVLNWGMCENCYNKWHEIAARYNEDIEFENRIFEKYKRFFDIQ